MKPKAIVPDNFLTEFELIRVPIDAFGSMGNLGQLHVKLLAGFFILGKVLVVKILMSPQKMGLPVKFTERVLMNFKILTAVIYYCLLEYLTTMTEKVKFD